jgi:hypothetical protein
MRQERIMTRQAKGCFFIMMMLAAATATAQPMDESAAQRQAMDRVASALDGRWQGAFRLDLDESSQFDVSTTFTVTRKADGTVLLFDIEYTSSKAGHPPDGALHGELALLSYDPIEKVYRFDLHFADGRHETGPATFKDSVLRITNTLPDGGRRRLIIDRRDPDVWHETGERSADGTSWRKYLDAEFKRVPAASST